MSFDSIRGYIQVASGITDATRARAMEVAQGLISMASKGAPADLAATVSAIADDVLGQARSNREMLLRLIRQEVDDLIESSSALVRTTDLDALRDAISQIASDIDGLRQQVGRETPARLISSGAAAMATVAGQGRKKTAPAEQPISAGPTPSSGSAAKPKRVPPRRRGAALAESRTAEPATAPPAKKAAATPTVKKAAPARKVAAAPAGKSVPAAKKAAGAPTPAVKKVAPAKKAAETPVVKKAATAPARKASPAKKAAAVPATRKPAARVAENEPVVETPVAENEPVVETPVVETPVVEAPVVESPVVEASPEPTSDPS